VIDADTGIARTVSRLRIGRRCRRRSRMRKGRSRGWIYYFLLRRRKGVRVERRERIERVRKVRKYSGV
jgi:hypothetical protein